MQARPTNPELSTAVREFLEAEILPTLTDARLKFHTLVAMNALSMLERAPLEQEFLQEELGLLTELLNTQEQLVQAENSLEVSVKQLNITLCQQIRAGDTPQRTIKALKTIAISKLKIASPNYLKRSAV